MKILLVSASLGMLLLNACATTVTESVAKNELAGTNGSEAQQKDKVVCEMMESTGSHVKKRVCLTSTQKDLIRKQAQEEAQRMRGTEVGNAGKQ